VESVRRGAYVECDDSVAGSGFFHLDEQLSQEEIEILERVHAFCETEVVPIAHDHCERAEFPSRILAACAIVER
jgi:glutaryl-CoA dehydrogenase